MFGSFANSGIAFHAPSKSRSVKPSIKIAAGDSFVKPSESPIPELMRIGSPHARYSPFLVGDEASLEKQRLINERPTSPAAKYDGISFGTTLRMEKLSSLIPRVLISCRTRSQLPVVSQSRCASFRFRTTLAKKSAISSVKYQPSSEPL